VGVRQIVSQLLLCHTLTCLSTGLHAWLSGLDDNQLTMMIDTLTAILAIGDADGLFEEDSHD
jgi:hypothetical protein